MFQGLFHEGVVENKRRRFTEWRGGREWTRMRDEKERNRKKERSKRKLDGDKDEEGKRRDVVRRYVEFNLCPVSRSAKWNLFASLCGTTLFCRSSRRLTRNYK